MIIISKLVNSNKKIADKLTGYYNKIEDTVVDNYNKIEDKFVEKYLLHNGETIEQAKQRLKKEQEKLRERND